MEPVGMFVPFHPPNLRYVDEMGVKRAHLKEGSLGILERVEIIVVLGKEGKRA